MSFLEACARAVKLKTLMSWAILKPSLVATSVKSPSNSWAGANPTA